MNQEHLKLDPKEIISFWQNAGPSCWFTKDDEFDKSIQQKYNTAPDLALAGHLDQWLDKSTTSLALILILDQFPRNIFRNDPRSYHYDDRACQKAEIAINNGHDRDYEIPLRRFYYLPFMHSEKIEDQQYCIDLCKKSDDAEGIEFGELHLDIIERFGRFPHRNDVLGRTSTKEEIEFLNSGGFQG